MIQPIDYKWKNNKKPITFKVYTEHYLGVIDLLLGVIDHYKGNDMTFFR